MEFKTTRSIKDTFLGTQKKNDCFIFTEKVTSSPTKIRKKDTPECREASSLMIRNQTRNFAAMK